MVSVPSGIYYKRKLDRDKKRSKIVRKLPLRVFSRYFGKICDLQLPAFIKMPIFRLFTYLFVINTEEMNAPLRSFESFSDLFARSINIEKHRPVSDADIVSPVDGKITSFGKILPNKPIDSKGLLVPLENFIGRADLKIKNLYYVTFYLSPGDYHRFHSPMEWSISRLRHFVGDLLPVSPLFTQLFPNLFSLNERVVLEGTWKHGYCSFTPIGAFNVGSIRLSPNIDMDFTTNQTDKQISKEVCFLDSVENGICVRKIEELGHFKMGSSVVMIFEVPEEKEFLFRIREGEISKVGEEIGIIY